MQKKIYLFITILLSTLQAAAQGSLFLGAGPSVNHIRMDIAPTFIPHFDVIHRLSVNAEVLYGYRFPNRRQLLAGAGMYSFKYGIEAGPTVHPNKIAFPKKYLIHKNYMQFGTITPVFLTAGSTYNFISKPRFEADASLMIDAVFLKKGNLLPLEKTIYGIYYNFDQYTYKTGWKFYLQPGIRLKRTTRHNFAYWIKAKASIRTGSVMEVNSSALQHENKDYEATIKTSGSTFAILAGVELPLSGKPRQQKTRDPDAFTPKRQLITARVGISSQSPKLVEDTGGMLQAAPHIGGYVGVMIEERIKGPFYIGAGLTNYTLSEYYTFSLPSGQLPSGSSGTSLWGVPVSLALYQTNNRWSARLAGSLGYIFSFMKNSSQGGYNYQEATALLENGDEFNFKVDTHIPHSSTLYVDLDISGSYSLSPRVALHSFVGYSYGFNKFFESHITYQYNEQEAHQARMDFGLSHLNFGLGLRYVLAKY